MINKRGTDLMHAAIIFLMITAVVFLGLFAFVQRTDDNISLLEQTYSKQIALLIDAAKPGTSLSIDVLELKSAAEKNKFAGNVVIIDGQKEEVRVQVSKGSGYSYSFFNGNELKYSIDKTRLILEVEK